MARRKQFVTIEGSRSENPGERDNGKTFIVTEMPADIGERWAAQYIHLCIQAGATFPAGATDVGMAGLAASGLNFADVAMMRALQDPSLDSLWDYIEYQHDPRHPPQKILAGENSQIEEIRTRSRLRQEFRDLHLNFSQGSSGSSSESSPPSPASSNTPTSPA
jgi:hypothetical protein